MRRKYIKSIKRKIEKYCDSHYEKISRDQMELGNGLFNRRCQLNAVQQVKAGGMKEVYSCICFNDTTYPFIHFINKNENDKFIDNTLGYEYEIYDYYIINKIEESQYKNMNNLLMNIKESIFNNCSNVLLNTIFFVTHENIGI